MKTAVVYAGDPDGIPLAHPVHRTWAEEELGATPLVMRKAGLPGPLSDSTLSDLLLGTTNLDVQTGYDAYLIESPSVLYALPYLRARDPDALFIFLHTTWRFRGRNAHNLASWSVPMRALVGLDRTLDARILHFLLDRYVDGVLTVSEFIQNDVQQYHDVPVAVVHPYIDSTLAKELDKVSPSYAQNRVVTVGAARAHKGTDLLVEAWPTVRNEYPDARLSIVGSGHPESYADVSGVDVMGYVESLADVFASHSLSVHAARIDAFPVSTLETMYAGLPTIVSTETGTKSRAVNVNPSFVVRPSSDAIANEICDYFALPEQERQERGEMAHAAVEALVEDRISKPFTEVWDDFITHVELSKNQR